MLLGLKKVGIQLYESNQLSGKWDNVCKIMVGFGNWVNVELRE